MKRVTLRQLRVFEQVARLRSVSAAAGVCHLTQPAVSMQLKALEQECGLPLTELIGRQLRLTEAGETVAVYARRVQQQLDELDQKLASMRGQQHGKLNVGIVSTAKYFASHMLATFLEEHAGAELSLQVENRAQILRCWPTTKSTSRSWVFRPNSSTLSRCRSPIIRTASCCAKITRSHRARACRFPISRKMHSSCASPGPERARSWSVSSRANRFRRAR